MVHHTAVSDTIPLALASTGRFTHCTQRLHYNDNSAGTTTLRQLQNVHRRITADVSSLSTRATAKLSASLFLRLISNRAVETKYFSTTITNTAHKSAVLPLYKRNCDSPTQPYVLCDIGVLS